MYACVCVCACMYVCCVCLKSNKNNNSRTLTPHGCLHQDCHALQVVDAAEKLPRHLHWPELTPEVAVLWACLQQMFCCHTASLVDQFKT